MTVGQIVPTILLPIGWREWDSAKLQAVLAHEEAHVRRADWAIGVMARINCCVFWFHPLAWWLKRELALLAEYACDDLALAQMGDRRQYARALLEIAYAMKSAHGRLLGDAVPMAKETNVEKRMEQILDDTRAIPPAFRTARLGNFAGVQLASGISCIGGSVGAGAEADALRGARSASESAGGTAGSVH